MSAIATDSPGMTYTGFRGFGSLLRAVLAVLEHLAGLTLAANVLVVFLSVIYRYFLHDPLDWAEEVARALMVVLVFFGAATVLGRGRHAGIDVFREMFPPAWRICMTQICCWIVVAVAVALFITACGLFIETEGQVTPLGLPHWINILPVIIGSFFIVAFGLANALEGPPRQVWLTFAAGLACAGGVWAWNTLLPEMALSPLSLLVVSAMGSVVIGVPIAFALAFSALLYFLADPSLPIVVYAQQLAAGADHFVLLAIPFFVLAGLTMEANGMSTRLIELLLRLMGRMRGGLNLISIVATALFSGISGSKLADIAAVSGIIMPAVRRTRQDPNDAAGLLACTAVMAETIPPCVNLIIFAFVANISVGGLFMAGIVPAALLALCLSTVAIVYGRRIDTREAFPVRRSLPRLIGGSLVALVMVMMIGRGVTAGVATSTEISAFAVVYALMVGGLAFRELTLRSVVKLLVNAASMAGGILFIMSAASGFAFALTIEQIPSAMSGMLVSFGHTHGSLAFMVLATLLMVVFGAVLEGAPALIIFGPLLTPIAAQLGISSLHFGTVMVVAMGFGLFAPPVGLGLFATCAMTGTRMQDVARPMAKYLAVLLFGMVLLVLFPAISLWLPNMLGMG